MTFLKVVSTEDRFWSKVRKTDDGCWFWLGGKIKGYGRFAIDRRRYVRAHRYSFELTRGPVPDGLGVLHECDNPGCVRPDHLFVGTDADNVADRDAKGRTARGDRSGARTVPSARPRGDAHAMSKLTGPSVALLKQRLRDGATQREVADEFGVASPTISHIVAGRTWRHVA